MSSALPPLAAVRAFEAAARLLNFTEAAQSLGMTQAAISYQIKTLEERLGTSLFHRIGRRIELTPQGQALAPTIIGAFDQMRGAFASLSADTASVLTISCTSSFAHLWLAPQIGQFQMLQPDLAVRIHASNSLVDFTRDQIDVAIRGGAGDWPGLDAQLLRRNRIAPMCSPDFLARAGRIETPHDLLAQPRLSPQDYWWRQWFAAMGIADMPGQGPASIALDSQALEGRAALAGQGFAIVIPWFWQREIDAGLLVEPIPSDVTDAMHYWVAYPHATRNLPKIKLFRDWICAQFAQEQGESVAPPPPAPHFRELLRRQEPKAGQDDA